MGGFNRGPAWRIYFCGTFSEPVNTSSSGVFTYDFDPFQRSPIDPPTVQTLANRSAEAVNASAPVNSSTAVGALFSWTGAEAIESRIGISFISADKACSFVPEEAPQNQTFADTVSMAQTIWNEEVLSSVIIPGGDSRNTTMLRMLYTGKSLRSRPVSLIQAHSSILGLYYTALLPSNRTGENPLWNSTEPSYDDFYTIWDIFRCLTPWYHLVQSPRYTEMIRSIIDI